MALTLGWIIGIAVASTAVSYVMTQQAMKKAKKAADDMAGVLINKESNIEPIPVIYGERRVGGVRVFVSTKDVSGGAKNEFLYIALAMAEGEVESITDIHIDDNPITDSKYSGLYTINVHTGADNQTYDPLLTEANAGWTSSHKLSGVAYLAIRLKWDADVFQGVPEITAVVKGRKVYDGDVYKRQGRSTTQEMDQLPGAITLLYVFATTSLMIATVRAFLLLLSMTMPLRMRQMTVTSLLRFTLVDQQASYLSVMPYYRQMRLCSTT